MHRPRSPSRKRPLVDFSGTHKTIDILRDSNALLERIRRSEEAEAEDRAHEAEIQRLRRDVDLLPADDPGRAAAEAHLRFISSGPYRVWRETRLALKSFGRTFGHELKLALLIPLQVLLIAVFNVVAFLLLFWLLFGF